MLLNVIEILRPLSRDHQIRIGEPIDKQRLTCWDCNYGFKLEFELGFIFSESGQRLDLSREDYFSSPGVKKIGLRDQNRYKRIQKAACGGLGGHGRFGGSLETSWTLFEQYWRVLGRYWSHLRWCWAHLGRVSFWRRPWAFGTIAEIQEVSRDARKPPAPPRKWSPGSSQAQFFHVFCSYFFDWQNDIFFSMLLIVWYFKSWIQCNFIRFSKGKYYVIRPSPTQVKIESQSMTNRNKLIKCRLSPGGAQEALKKCPQHPRPPRPRYVNPYQGAFWSTKKVKEE